LADLASRLADRHDPQDRDDQEDDKKKPDSDGDGAKPAAPQPDSGPDPSPTAPPPPDKDVPTPVVSPAAAIPATAVAPLNAVRLPDGSTVTAPTAALAKAVTSCLSGTPIDDAYRQAGIELPPPGTPVTAPVDPSQLAAGSIGMYRDHYLVALSPAKALQDGQVVALASAAAGPGFLGWMDPASVGATSASPAPPPVAGPPVPDPLPTPAPPPVPAPTR
jgi:hypothetical protein